MLITALPGIFRSQTCIKMSSSIASTQKELSEAQDNLSMIEREAEAILTGGTASKAQRVDVANDLTDARQHFGSLIRRLQEELNEMSTQQSTDTSRVRDVILV